MPHHQIAFRTGALRSPCWSIAVDPNQMNIYLAREGTGDMAHLSLHGDHEWHLAAKGHPYLKMAKPPPHPNGITEGVRLAVPSSNVRWSEPAPDGAAVLEYPEDPTVCAQIVVLVGPPGMEIGVKNAALDHVWQAPLPDGGRCLVFTTASELPPARLSVPVEAEDLDRVSEELAKGNAGALVILQADGGPIILLDGPLPMHSGLMSDPA